MRLSVHLSLREVAPVGEARLPLITLSEFSQPPLRHCIILWLLLICFSSLFGCSGVTNTIAGLTTPQSTISGSTYPYWVDPATNKLKESVPAAGDVIKADDYFQVSLDFGFLRYLQAVDPYVIVYSETWVSSSVKPPESDKMLRQIVLLKDGISQNARLSTSSYPLLGPMTYEKDSPNVHVTLKIVVLSKRDNAQTISLVEGLASMAGAAMPQAAPIAGAAANAVGTFISQNRDKIEFEHTFVLSPSRDNCTTNPLGNCANILQEGRIVVLKGEDAFRVVPYHTWYYYLLPINWTGTYTSRESRKFEYDANPGYGGLGYLVRLPLSLVGDLFMGQDGRVKSNVNWLADVIFGTERGIFPPYMRRYDAQALPASLCLYGQYLYRRNPPDKDRLDGPDPVDCPMPSDPDFEKLKIHSYLNGSITSRYDYSPPLAFYADKTHMVFRIEKTLGTLGTFRELIDKFSEHGKTINALSTSPSESDQILQDKINKTFDFVKKELQHKVAKKQLLDDAKKGTFTVFDEKSLEDKKFLDRDSKLALVKASGEQKANWAVKKYKEFAQKQFGEAKNDTNKKQFAFEQIVTMLAAHKNEWTSGDQYDLVWKNAWDGVVKDLKDELLMNLSCIKGCFIENDWKGLEYSKNLAIVPSKADVPVEKGVNFTASGNTGKIVYTLLGDTSNEIKPDVSTGTYTAGSSLGIAVIGVTDEAGNVSTARVTVRPQLEITPLSQSIKVKEAVQFSATGGVPPYTFEVTTATKVGEFADSTSGQYTAGETPGTDTVRVTDSSKPNAQIKDTPITVTAPTP